VTRIHSHWSAQIGADEFMAELRPLDDNAVASVSP
jgi:hypothetical protein